MNQLSDREADGAVRALLDAALGSRMMAEGANRPAALREPHTATHGVRKGLGVHEDGVSFSPEELATLQEHGIVLFADRVIYEAQPPMTEERRAAVEAFCAGPVPESLAALWRHTAGGRLDYDLYVSMKGRIDAVSWSELFWDGSDGYRDLQGWIDYELELAAEAASDGGHVGSSKLAHLPVGGFEYLDRIYVAVEPGPERGSVVAWKQGLPPAWTDAMHEDGVGTIAPDLFRGFAALRLDHDPLAPGAGYFAGQSLLEYLDERHRLHGLELDLVDKLVTFYRRAMVH